MITIDIDGKIEAVDPKVLQDGSMSTVFKFRDANNPDTMFHVTFYKKQMTYILKQIHAADRNAVKEDLRKEFLARERKLKDEFDQTMLKAIRTVEDRVREEVFTELLKEAESAKTDD